MRRRWSNPGQDEHICKVLSNRIFSFFYKNLTKFERSETSFAYSTCVGEAFPQPFPSPFLFLPSHSFLLPSHGSPPLHPGRPKRKEVLGVAGAVSFPGPDCLIHMCAYTKVWRREGRRRRYFVNFSCCVASLVFPHAPSIFTNTRQTGNATFSFPEKERRKCDCRHSFRSFLLGSVATPPIFRSVFHEA